MVLAGRSAVPTLRCTRSLTMTGGSASYARTLPQHGQGLRRQAGHRVVKHRLDASLADHLPERTAGGRERRGGDEEGSPQRRAPTEELRHPSHHYNTIQVLILLHPHGFCRHCFPKWLKYLIT